VREHVRRIHFVGIGGAGMSGIAEVLVNQGYRVSGSDVAASAATRRLQQLGVAVQIGHAAELVTGCDVVVVSSAVSADNVEVAAARAAKIPVVPRAEMLGELMRFGKGIAIAGTHGKTTTTSLVAQVLAAAGLDPTFVVGGCVRGAGSHARLGKGEYIVAEADESDASFLQLQPLIAVVTNIDADHMDTYGGDIARLKTAFVDFLRNLPFYGLAVLCIDDPNVRGLLPRVHKPVLSYGLDADADVRATGLSQDGLRMRFTVHRPAPASPLAVELALAGRHNVLNALAAVAVAHKLGLPDGALSTALAEFQGIDRRFQVLGDMPAQGGRALVVDDYAHHPRELQATLEAAAGAWPGRRLVVAFQPHRYTRTRDLLDDFSAVLAGREPLLIAEVYAAGEAPIAGADGRALCRAIRARGRTDPVFVPHISELPAALRALLRDGDVVLALGAGDIGRVAARLVSPEAAHAGHG
jgi:UDP-N-acetylmuramate--alanine ligase